MLDLGDEPLSLGALWAAENKKYTTQGLVEPVKTYISPLDGVNLQFYHYAVKPFNLPDIMFED